MFSCKFCEISKNTYFYRTPPVAASHKACNFIKKETLAQVFSCEFCEISKNTFLTEHSRWLLLIIASHCQIGFFA